MKTYPAYKASGVDWLGKIPEHWEVASGFQFLYENKSKNKGMIRKQVLSLSYGNIRKKSKEELTGLVPESFETYQFVEKGDIIFRPTDLQNDKVSLRSAMSDYKGIITSAYLNLRLKKTANSRFYHYFFRALDNNKIIYGLGSGLRQNISYEDFRRFPFPLPPKPEQETIANFLDEACGKLDTVVAQKQKMITLLKERKQALIQKAVTRGLEEDVALKDSGVEWIGEIPVGWEVKRLKHLSDKIGDGLHGTPVFTNDTEIYFINGNNLTNGIVTIQENTKSVSYKEMLKYKKPLNKFKTILISINGTIGNISIYQGEEIMLGKSAAYINLKSNVYRKYVKMYLSSIMFKMFYEYELSGTTINNLSLHSIGKTLIIYPPKKEQEKIVQYIDIQSQKIDQAVRQQAQAIVQLKEYKASLVDSCVLGKIRVN